MRKKGASEIIATILLILIVILILSIVIYFLWGYLNKKEEYISIQNDLNSESERLAISDVDFNTTDNQKLTLVLAKGAGGETPTGRNQTNITRVNITVVKLVNQTNITYSMLVNITNYSIVNTTFIQTINTSFNQIINISFNQTIRVVNSTIVNITNSTLVNGSNADIVAVNDLSGSMDFSYGQGDKIGELKKALKNFINTTLNNTGNRIGLVGYSTNVNLRNCMGLTNNSVALINLVNAWYADGSTCICCGIDQAVAYLTASTRTKIMIVLSDGGANQVCPYISPELSGRPPSASGGSCSLGQNDACDDAIYTTQNAFRNYGIMTYSIGFGTAASVDDVTLKNISKVGNGTYYFSNLTGLEEIFRKIQQNLTNLIPVNQTFLQEMNITNSTLVNVTNSTLVNVTNSTLMNVTNSSMVNITWFEQINQTINVTVEIVIYSPIVSYDYLKIVFYAGGKSCSQRQNLSAVPTPQSTREVNLTLGSSCGMTTDQLTKIEVYAVALTSEGEEVLSSEPIAVWEKESMYTRK